MNSFRKSETAGGIRTISGSPPFARTTAVEADEHGVWAGDTDRPQVRQFGLGGVLLKIVKLPLEPVPVTPALVARALEEQLDNANDEEDRDLARQRWQEIPIPELLPYFDAL
jgi:hypothetical protein